MIGSILRHCRLALRERAFFRGAKDDARRLRRRLNGYAMQVPTAFGAPLRPEQMLRAVVR